MNSFYFVKRISAAFLYIRACFKHFNFVHIRTFANNNTVVMLCTWYFNDFNPQQFLFLSLLYSDFESASKNHTTKCDAMLWMPFASPFSMFHWNSHNEMAKINERYMPYSLHNGHRSSKIMNYVCPVIGYVNKNE